MKHNKLRGNLTKAGCTIFIFFFLYLVVGFFLNSKYPITQYEFNLSKAYEVLRDALTLTAYFLAPITAFVLFSSWQDQSKYNNFLNEVQNVRSILAEILKIGRIEYSIFSKDNKRMNVDDENRIKLSISKLNHCNIIMGGLEDLFIECKFNEYSKKASGVYQILLDCSQARADILLNLKEISEAISLHDLELFDEGNIAKNKYLREIQTNLDALELAERKIQKIYALLISMN